MTNRHSLVLNPPRSWNTAVILITLHHQADSFIPTVSYQTYQAVVSSGVTIPSARMGHCGPSALIAHTLRMQLRVCSAGVC